MGCRGAATDPLRPFALRKQIIRKFLLFIILAVPQSPWAESQPDSDATYYVSLAKVIVEPQSFVGYNISIVGFLSDTGDVLYLTEDHAHARDIATAVYISVAYRDSDISAHGIPSTGCESKFVRIFGTFDQSSNGEFSVRSVHKIQTFDRGGDLKLTRACWSNPAAAPAD